MKAKKLGFTGFTPTYGLGTSVADTTNPLSRTVSPNDVKDDIIKLAKGWM